MKRLWAIGLVLLLSGGVWPVAETIATPTVLPTKARFKMPKLPRRGAPGTRSAGASRDQCRTSSKALTALVPIDPDNQLVGGITTHSSPSLWFYTPYAAQCATLEFVLQEATGKVVYRAPVPVPQQSGMVAIALPPSVTLVTDQPYRWFLVAQVKDKQSTARYFVEGWIQRTLPSRELTTALKTAANPVAQSRLYAEAGVWYDALAPLATARLQHPTPAPLRQAWVDLLNSAGLESLVQ